MAKENKNHSQFLLFICERKSHKCSLSSWLWVARTVAILVKRNITCDINIHTFTICMYQTHKTQRIQTLNEQLWIYLVVTNGECVKTIENGIELKCGYFCCCWFFFFLLLSAFNASSMERFCRSKGGWRRLAFCVNKIVGFYEIIHKFYIFRMQIRTDVHSIRLNV